MVKCSNINKEYKESDVEGRKEIMDNVFFLRVFVFNLSQLKKIDKRCHKNNNEINIRGDKDKSIGII